MLAYVCDILYICFSLYYLYLVCNRAPTHGGLGCRGAAPCVNQAQNLLRPPSAASVAAQPPRPQGASFRRKREPRGVGEGRNRCKRHALKRWFGSDEVSPDGGAGAEPPASINRRARRAGRRSRRACRAQASAGSASRAKLGKGENSILA